jgi:undecaprenyl-diphosphatase
LWVVALLIAAGIGASRIYLGVHWTTDVLGGWALATAWLAFVLTVTTVLAHLRPGSSLLPPH